MSGFLGQVPQEVEALASDLDSKAAEVETIVSQITTRFGATTWTGPDRDSFESAWNGEITNNLVQLASALREAGTTARNNAQQQLAASS